MHRRDRFQNAEPCVFSEAEFSTQSCRNWKVCTLSVQDSLSSLCSCIGDEQPQSDGQSKGNSLAMPFVQDHQSTRTLAAKTRRITIRSRLRPASTSNPFMRVYVKYPYQIHRAKVHLEPAPEIVKDSRREIYATLPLPDPPLPICRALSLHRSPPVRSRSATFRERVRRRRRVARRACR